MIQESYTILRQLLFHLRGVWHTFFQLIHAKQGAQSTRVRSTLIDNMYVCSMIMDLKIYGQYGGSRNLGCFSFRLHFVQMELKTSISPFLNSQTSEINFKIKLCILHLKFIVQFCYFHSLLEEFGHHLLCTWPVAFILPWTSEKWNLFCKWLSKRCRQNGK